ncbi:MAG: hypothetical protein KC910_10445 [Candidatus Eremiobacteraeota bacterium]|nr:hypothetical protein [Candidatus Eremiobacteraeota bacterium]
MTLIELIIYAGLSLLLLGLLFYLLWPSARASGAATAKVRLHQMATNVLSKLARDLASSNASAISLLDSGDPAQPVGLALVQPRGLSASGQTSWQTEAICYLLLPDEGRLVRQLCPPEPPSVVFVASRPTLLSTEELLAVAQNPNQTRRTLAQQVTRFDIYHEGDTRAQVVSPLRVRIRLEADVPGRTAPEVFELERTLALRD